MIPSWGLHGCGHQDPGKALVMLMAEAQEYKPSPQAHFEDVFSLLRRLLVCSQMPFGDVLKVSEMKCLCQPDRNSPMAHSIISLLFKDHLFRVTFADNCFKQHPLLSLYALLYFKIAFPSTVCLNF